MHNSINYNDKFYCRVCGLRQSDPPWGEDGDSPSWNICACCGTEAGYEDCNLTAIKINRKRWLEQNAVWWRPKERPLNWNLEEQLKHIPPQFL